MSSDGGLLALREVEQRLAIAQRLAACIPDPRSPDRVRQGLDEIIGTRMLMIAAGYEDGNDADIMRRETMLKLAMGRLPDDADLCSQPNISRFENLPVCAPCCGWDGPWLITIVTASDRRPPALCSTSTTPSMPFMSDSNCASSMSITTIMVFNQSWCLTAAAA